MLSEQECEIHCAYFSNCAQSTESLGFETNRLLSECRKSCDILSIDQKNVFQFDVPTRAFPQYRQEILEQLGSSVEK
jgi:hypothetical protein